MRMIDLLRGDRLEKSGRCRLHWLVKCLDFRACVVVELHEPFCILVPRFFTQMCLQGGAAAEVGFQKCPIPAIFEDRPQSGQSETAAPRGSESHDESCQALARARPQRWLHSIA